MSLENRLAQLRNEAEKGRAELETLEQRRQEIYSTLLRISGAIQVLEEMREDRHLDEVSKH
jgi:uncharacterized protein (UPF0147 family)